MIHFLLRFRQALFSPIQKIQLYMQPKIIKGEHALLDFVDVLKEIYFHEVDILKNIYFCKLFLNDKFDEEKIPYDDYRDLLQLIRFVNGLPEIYKSKVKNLGYFEKVINELDDTIQNFAEYKNKFQ